jgi:crossover junction endodeoxyribonuclease RusA
VSDDRQDRHDDRQDRHEARIVIPMEPPRELSPNARTHWSERQRWVRMWRDAGRLSVYGSLLAEQREAISALRGVAMDVEIHWGKGRRVLDDDNAWASMKAARDGIADVLFGGEDRYIVQGAMRQCRGAGTTTITLREVGHG